MLSLLFPWGVILQAIALVHFIRRRPDTIWFWLIIFLGPLGALVYIGMEVLPDLGLLRHVFDSERITFVSASSTDSAVASPPGGTCSQRK